jgi:hypothetical protein
MCDKMSKVNSIYELFPDYKDLQDDFEADTASVKSTEKGSCEIF